MFGRKQPHAHFIEPSNCLFHDLAQQLGDRLVTQQTLRRDIVQYMREHPDHFEPFVAEDDSYESYDDYCKYFITSHVNNIVTALTKCTHT